MPAYTRPVKTTFECIGDKVETRMNCDKVSTIILVIPFKLYHWRHSNLHAELLLYDDTTNN